MTSIEQAIDAYKLAYDRYRYKVWDFEELKLRPSLEYFLHECGCYCVDLKHYTDGRLVVPFLERHVGPMNSAWKNGYQSIWFNRVSDARFAAFYLTDE